jgi:hypothetical protein
VHRRGDQQRAHRWIGAAVLPLLARGDGVPDTDRVPGGVRLRGAHRDGREHVGQHASVCREPRGGGTCRAEVRRDEAILAEGTLIRSSGGPCD